MATGIAALALLSAAVMVVTLLFARWAPTAAAESRCKTPVEVAVGHAVRLACGEGWREACGVVEAGDLLVANDKGCEVLSGQMSVAGRWAVGMPLLVNRATSEQLQWIEGIGPATAAAIVASRAESGAFESIDSLVRVKGIGPKTVAKLRGLVSVEP